MKRSFTLVELLIVIAILGLLVSLATFSYGKAQAKARDSKRKQDLKSIQTALNLYYQDNDAYPPAVNRSLATVLASSSFLVPNYIQSIPSDPKHDGTEYNSYHYDNYCKLNDLPVGTQCFRLYVWLENNNDPQKSGYTEAGRQIYWIFSPGATIGP